MRRRLAITLLLLLVACGQDLKTIDLESLAIQPGDLPSGFEAAQVLEGQLPLYNNKGIDTPTKAMQQRFERNNQNAGFVAIMLFDKMESGTKAYTVYVDGMQGEHPTSDIGEEATIAATNIAGLQFSEGVFRRCGAVVAARFLGLKDETALAAYMKRLDKRLQEAIC